MSLVRYVKLRVPAAAAKPGPSIGQALGPLGEFVVSSLAAALRWLLRCVSGATALEIG